MLTFIGNLISKFRNFKPIILLNNGIIITHENFVILLFYFFHLIYILKNASIYNLLRDFNVDDSFYYYQIAFNLATENISSFDGINLTNGYHPIWAYTLATIFVFTKNKVLALYAIKILEIIICFLSAITISAGFRNLKIPSLYAIIVAVYILYYDHYILGLESAISLLLISILFLLLTLFSKESHTKEKYKYFLLAITTALIPWARLELIAVPICIGFYLWLFPRCSRNVRLVSFILIFSSFVSLLLYISINLYLFNTPFPVSGKTKSIIFTHDLLNWDIGFSKLPQNFLHIIQFKEYLIPIICSLFVFGIGIFLYVTKRISNSILYFTAFIFGLAACTIARSLYYSLTVHPKYALHSWYFTNSDLLIWFLIPAIYLLTIKRLQAIQLETRLIIKGLYISIFLTLGLLFITKKPIILDFTNKTNTDWEIASYYMANIINRSFGENEIILSKDSGVLGYFSNATIINIDGLVNSNAYLNARINKIGVDFLLKYKPSYFINLFQKNITNINSVFCRTVDGRKNHCTTSILNNKKVFDAIPIRYSNKDYSYQVYQFEHKKNELFIPLNSTKKENYQADFFGKLFIGSVENCNNTDVIRLRLFPENNSFLSDKRKTYGFWDLNIQLNNDNCTITKSLPTIKFEKVVASFIRNNSIVDSLVFEKI